jgi:diguanylate cyclase (GGDEF)-like protein
MSSQAANDDAPLVVADTLTELQRENGELRMQLARLEARLAEVEGLADRDGLTPLLNRRALLRELGRTRATVSRYGGAASLVYFDLDGLKAINDRFGHPGGDAALRAAADRILSQVRASDIAGRLGGDEFAVILVQADGFQAEVKAEALAQAICQEPVDGLPASLRLRVSWGVAEIQADLEPEDILAQADAAMYAAKHGRK